MRLDSALKLTVGFWHHNPVLGVTVIYRRYYNKRMQNTLVLMKRQICITI